MSMFWEKLLPLESSGWSMAGMESVLISDSLSLEGCICEFMIKNEKIILSDLNISPSNTHHITISSAAPGFPSPASR